MSGKETLGVGVRLQEVYRTDDPIKAQAWTYALDALGIDYDLDRRSHRTASTGLTTMFVIRPLWREDQVKEGK